MLGGVFKAIALRAQRLSRALRSGIARGCLESDRVYSRFAGRLSRASRLGAVCGGFASERGARPKRCALSGALKGGGGNKKTDAVGRPFLVRV